MCDESKSFKDNLYMRFEYLRKVIDLLKCPTLAYAINKKKRAFVPISNCSLCVHRCGMSSVELVLNAI